MSVAVGTLNRIVKDQTDALQQTKKKNAQKEQQIELRYLIIKKNKKIKK